MLKLFILSCLTVNALAFVQDENVLEGRIIGGKDTNITQVPYQVSLYVGYLFWCGGTIISPSFILTAGRCTVGSRDDVMQVRAGSSFTTNDFKLSTVKKIHRHPRFDEYTGDYDVSVVELKKPFKLDNETMRAIKLATKEPSPGSVALASGWGSFKESEEIPKMLQSVSVPIVDRKTCENKYKAVNVTINSRVFCAGEKGKMIRQGDQGGPLVYKDELVGIMEFGWQYGNDLPGVYTNIANPEIINFIKDIVKY